MKIPNIAVVLFPGNNCENETLRAIEACGMSGKIIRWNDPKAISEFDGYVLPGGWAYEDRIRAGVIAAQDPLMNRIRKEAEKGKPVLGICNGCQVLVETGMVPELDKDIMMALAPNKNPLVSGFYCTWVNIRNNGNRTFFNNQLRDKEVIPIPIAHGEGRFVSIYKDVISKLNKNKQIIFQYSDSKGNVEDKFPINPNGSIENIAGICNKEGNVLGMMPHPERATWMRQLPTKGSLNFEQMESLAPASKIFLSMKEYIK